VPQPAAKHLREKADEIVDGYVEHSDIEEIARRRRRTHYSVSWSGARHRQGERRQLGADAEHPLFGRYFQFGRNFCIRFHSASDAACCFAVMECFSFPPIGVYLIYLCGQRSERLPARDSFETTARDRGTERPLLSLSGSRD